MATTAMREDLALNRAVTSWSAGAGMFSCAATRLTPIRLPIASIFGARDDNDIVRNCQTGLDTLDVSEFDDDVLLRLEQSGDYTTVTVGDVTIPWRGSIPTTSSTESLSACALTPTNRIQARLQAR